MEFAKKFQIKFKFRIALIQLGCDPTKLYVIGISAARPNLMWA